MPYNYCTMREQQPQRGIHSAVEAIWRNTKMYYNVLKPSYILSWKISKLHGMRKNCWWYLKFLKSYSGNVVPQTRSKKPIMQNFKVSWNMQKLAKAWPFSIVICSMVLCIISPNLRLLAEIQKAEIGKEREHHLGGQTDKRPARRTYAMIGNNTSRPPSAAEGKNIQLQ